MSEQMQGKGMGVGMSAYRLCKAKAQIKDYRVDLNRWMYSLVCIHNHVLLHVALQIRLECRAAIENGDIAPYLPGSECLCPRSACR